jgi:hypothetical protein
MVDYKKRTSGPKRPNDIAAFLYGLKMACENSIFSPYLPSLVAPRYTPYKGLGPMLLRPHIREYLCSVGYAALIFIPLREPGLLAASLLDLTICASLLGMLFLFLAYRNEIRELVLDVLHACTNLLLSLLPVLQPIWLPANRLVRPADPFHCALCQRPPPRFA